MIFQSSRPGLLHWERKQVLILVIRATLELVE